ncbi:putative MFS general substrate transporter [Lyophyllum shimeji]|uniref:MFS general substrate transporter n=1 Tax=Lyophyllum shimeji TaxID=47721 RepID=A0A9P3PQJ9_LYOSH|nr:putative MFS general substrate transporter [Lyophyllum shimeji]
MLSASMVAPCFTRARPALAVLRPIVTALRSDKILPLPLMSFITDTAPLSPKAEHDQHDQARYSPNESSIPDGGLRAWSTVIGAWFMMFAMFGYINSFGVYQDFYTRDFLSESTPSRISWIGSLQFFMPFAFGIVSGKLFDAGHFHVLVATGSVLFSFSLFMLSLAEPHHYYQVFLSQGLGMGMGIGLTFVPTVSILVHHFERRRALASGIALSGSSLGAVMFPIMLNHLIPRIGFSQAVRATAYIVLGCLVAANALMRTNKATADLRAKAPPPDVRIYLKDAPYMVAVFGCLMGLFGVYFPIFYLQLYSVHRADVGTTLAFYSLAIVNACSAVGRISGNFFADRFGPWNLQAPCALVTAATIWAVLGVKDPATLIVVSILYGLFSGAGLSLSVAGWASLAQTPHEAGARTGVALAVASFGILGSAPAQGALLGKQFRWIQPIAFAGTLVLGSSVLFLITRSLLVRKRGTWKV